MNNINILGTITREPELKYTAGGIAILSFGIAYNEKRKQQDGSYADTTHFFEVTSFGKKAEVVNQWFQKGSRILIQGSLDYQSWEKDGQKKSKVGIKLNDFDFIDKRETNKEAYPQQSNNKPNHTAYQPKQPQASQDRNQSLPDYDDDMDQNIPF